MTFRRATRKVAAIATLLAFLSQSALALAAMGNHAIHPSVSAPAMSVPAVSVHESHAITHRVPADVQHESLHHHAAAAAPAVESIIDSACDDDRSCLCCIGSCASILLNSAADPKASSLSSALLFSLESLLSRTSAAPYRPPITL